MTELEQAHEERFRMAVEVLAAREHKKLSDEIATRLAVENAKLREALMDIGNECSPFHSDGRTHEAQAIMAYEKARAALSPLAIRG